MFWVMFDEVCVVVCLGLCWVVINFDSMLFMLCGFVFGNGVLVEVVVCIIGVCFEVVGKLVWILFDVVVECIYV